MRLNILLNKRFCKLLNYKLTTFILLIFSAIFYSPNLFTKHIVPVKLSSPKGSNITLYRYDMVNNDIGNGETGKTLLIVTNILRGFISAAVIVIINIISKIKLAVVMENKSKMKGSKNKVQSSKKYNFTLLN